MASQQKCCVPKCPNETSKRHYITTTPKYQEIWLRRINSEKLCIENARHTVICEDHFEKHCIGPNGKLLRGALPTLNLPGYERTVGDSFAWFSPEKDPVTPPKTRSKECSSTASNQASDSPELSVKIPEKVYGGRKRLFSESLEDHHAGESTSADCQIIEGFKAHKTVGVRKRVEQSEQKNLRRELAKWKRTARRATNLNNKQRLRHLGKKKCELRYLKNVNSTTINFFLSQMRNQRLKPKGRRFSLDDKIFALSIYKQSAKSYRFLSKVFSLPSSKTLSNLINRIPFNCGYNEQIFQNLKRIVSKQQEKEKYCILMFDEISLSRGLNYNYSKDCIEGIVDFGSGDRRIHFADHALVFMLQGIYKKWKQPICYYFCESTTSTIDLVRILKEIIVHIRLIGLELVATVCDQGATNRAAVNYLLRDTNAYCLRNNIENKFHGYLVDGKEIIHFFDCPHLLKGVRNALLTKDLHFTENGENKIASWSHIVDTYRKDAQMGKFSQFPKLTDEHVLPHRIKKMKVKNCTQVFSRTVASAMKVRAVMSKEVAPSSQLYIDPLASQTADCLLLFDELFDSVNGSLLKPPPGKQLRGVVTKNSTHVATWQHYIPILKSMFFAVPNSSHKTITPSLQNFTFTLHSFIKIWKILQDKGFKYISPRCFNQDPIENFFSLIRSHGHRNTNPTCSCFVSSFKSLLLNNFMSLHSPQSNCEPGQSCGALDTLKQFLTHQTTAPQIEEYDTIPPVYPSYDRSVSDVNGDLAISYVLGYICRSIFSKVDCKNCKSILLSSGDIAQNVLIKQRQFQKSSLVYPSERFIEVFNSLTNEIYSLLPKFLTAFNMRDKIKREIDCSQFESLFCHEHFSFIDLFVNKTITLTIFRYVKTVNRILSGKDHRYKDADVIMKLAFDKYSKTRPKHL